jgi:hypothetical protein
MASPRSPKPVDLRGLPLKDWPPDLREDFEERAAIVEFMGNETRETAEVKARAMVIRSWKRERGIE